MVANGFELNGLNRIFANKGNCGKRFGAPLYYPKYRHVARNLQWGGAVLEA